MIKKLIASLMRVLISLVFAGFFYVFWMAVAITALKSGSGKLVMGFLWIIAPLVTAAGFTIGIGLFDFAVRQSRPEFWKIYKWPLVGCIIGAAAVFPFGPMLIVFGMFVLGTLSVILREVMLRKYQ
jgi:hypothetical protein